MKTLRYQFALSAAIISALAAFISTTRAMDGLDEGVAAYQAWDLTLAMKEFRVAAEKGDADCQHNLDMMYEQSILTAKNDKEAVSWYLKSAEQCYSSGQFWSDYCKSSRHPDITPAKRC